MVAKNMAKHATRVRAKVLPKEQKTVNRKSNKTRSSTVNSRVLNYIMSHLYALVSSFGRIVRTPMATIMTVLVISIAFTLPIGLYVLLQNAQKLTERWHEGGQISIYLKNDVDRAAGQKIAQSLERRQDVNKATYISPEAGLKDFSKYFEFPQLITSLEDNPLPGVIEIVPANLNEPFILKNLILALQQLPEGEQVQVDMAWIKRLTQLLNLLEQNVYLLGLFFAVAVFLIVGNTIRLIVQNDHEEIEIVHWVGATKAFIRRPFLYAGLYYGLGGGIMSCIWVSLALLWLDAPVQQLATLYDNAFYLQGLQPLLIFWILVMSSMLGLLGAWLAVSRQLAKVETKL